MWKSYSTRELAVGLAFAICADFVLLVFIGLPDSHYGDLEYTETSTLLTLTLMLVPAILFIGFHTVVHFMAGLLVVWMRGVRAEYILPWANHDAVRFGRGRGTVRAARNGHGVLMTLPSLIAVMAVLGLSAAVVIMGRVGTGTFATDAVIWFAHFAALAYPCWLLYEYGLMRWDKSTLQWRTLETRAISEAKGCR